MKTIIKIAFLTFTIVSVSSISGYAQFGYTIDHVEGTYGNGVKPGVPVVFHMRAYNNSGQSVICVTTGFRVYISKNGDISGATFSPIMHNTDVNWAERFTFIYSVNSFSVDGVGADTIGVGALNFSSADIGFEDGYDDIVFTLTTEVDASNAGDSLCIDSSFYPPTGSWTWALGSISGLQTPNWSGPHCYEILPSCCINYAGNYDNSDDDQINVFDLEYMKNFMFEMGPLPSCYDEGDPNVDGMHDISDMVYMVSYMFLGGPQPLDCP